jgi:glycosyltransferase involved in cell wall biosynthesis
VRVAVDAQLAVGSATGIGEYVAQLCRALPAAGVDAVALQEPRLDPWRFDRRVLWDQILLPAAARRARAELLHCASGTMPVVAPLPIVATVHDVAWLRVQSHARWYARAYFGRLATALYPRARRIMVDSAFSRDELTALLPIDPARVDVVYPGVAADVAQVRRAPGEPLVLVIGTVERRKNLELVIRALGGVPAARLVVVGPLTGYRADCERIAAEAGVASRVEIRGYILREALLDLLARAALVAVPSRYEGFGYAAAWALCAGAPVIAAATSSLPEVVGADGILLDPDDVAGWRDAIAAIVSDPGAAGERAAAARPRAVARFSVAAAASRAAACYGRALAN